MSEGRTTPAGTAYSDEYLAGIKRSVDNVLLWNKGLEKKIAMYKAALAEAHAAIAELNRQVTQTQNALYCTINELVCERPHNNMGVCGSNDAATNLNCRATGLAQALERSDSSNTIWPRRGWLSEPLSRVHLHHIEELWNSPYPRHQEALAEVNNFIRNIAIPFECQLDAMLLKSVILRDHALCNSSPLEELGRASLEQALALIQDVLGYTNKFERLPEIWELRDKAHFHQGMCLFEMGRFEEAVLTLRGYVRRLVVYQELVDDGTARSKVELKRRKALKEEKARYTETPTPQVPSKSDHDSVNVVHWHEKLNGRLSTILHCISAALGDDKD